MTLKEKVAEVEPDRVKECYDGGVLGCPKHHPYLNLDETEEAINCKCDIPFYAYDIYCEDCWNREYKEETL